MSVPEANHEAVGHNPKVHKQLVPLFFRFDILYANLRPHTAKVTRVISYVGASMATLAIPGLILWLHFDLLFVGLPLTIFPLIIDTLGISIITIVVAYLAKKKVNGKLQEHNVRKVRYVRHPLKVSENGKSLSHFQVIRLFSALSVSWTVYTILTIMGFLMQVSAPLLYSYAGLVFWLIHRCCEATIALSLLALIDRGGGPLRLTRFVCCGKEYDDSGKVNSTSLGAKFSSTNDPDSIKEPTNLMRASSSEKATVEARSRSCSAPTR